MDRPRRSHWGDPSVDDGVVTRGLPVGTVTFLFTDIEGSTRLLHELGPDAYAAALAEHRRVLRDAFRVGGGVEVDTQGDAFFVAFPTAPGALAAARLAMKGLQGGPVRVRVGLHTGTPLVTDEGYVGVDVHRAARIAAAGHGGQALLSSATASLVDQALLRDLGEHRLKDLSAPERVYQIGDEDFPRLKSLHQTNLPVPATPFLGRRQELHELRQLLKAPHPRLVTLTGPGGSGKTRLALQAAAEAADAFSDGVFWVPLATVGDPGAVLATIGQALGTGDSPAQHIGGMAMLLVLDNVEQLIDAAPEVAGLLTACPRLHVLVTSRELLAVAGEQVYPVPPLLPDDSVEMFVARAQTVRPDFAPTPVLPALCAQLDHLPLALELAAARVRMMSVEQLAARLGNRLDLLRAGRGANPRQQTLRTTVAWSYDLLSAAEQQLFARLSIFVGGCTLEAAEAVCDADLDVLQSLVDKSLCRLRDDGRFWMLETIREFALECLSRLPDADARRRRHAEHFRAQASGEAYSWNALEATPDAFPAVQIEYANLLAALDYFEQDGDRNATLELTAALGPFWLVGGFFRESRSRLERALLGDPEPSPARAAALDWLAETLTGIGDLVAARRRAQEALELHRSLADWRGAAESLRILGYCSAEEGDLLAARDLHQQCLALLETGPPDGLTTWIRRSIAWVSWELGDLDEARREYEAALTEARRQGNRSAEATMLGALGLLASEQGRLDNAFELSRESMTIWRELHDPFGVAERVGGVASMLVAAGLFPEAARALAYSRALLAQIGAAPGWVTKMNTRTESALAEVLSDVDLNALQASVANVALDDVLTWLLDVLTERAT